MFVKQKVDKFIQESFLSWLNIHVQNTSNPRQYGKALSRNLDGKWRYRVGNYRVICAIEEDQLVVLALEVGHKKKVYK